MKKNLMDMHESHSNPLTSKKLTLVTRSIKRISHYSCSTQGNCQSSDDQTTRNIFDQTVALYTALFRVAYFVTLLNNVIPVGTIIK